jgi:hypothetical protein
MWIINILIKLPTMLLGFFIIPILYLYRHREFDDVPKIFLPWQNPEDWKGCLKGTEHSIPQWWVNEMGTGFWAFYKYHAIRNPANGLRNFDFIDLDLEQDKIYYWTPRYLQSYEPNYMTKNGVKSAGYVCWQGWMAGVKFVHVWNAERHFVFKFGWRVEPRDAIDGYKETSQRWHDGAGFASKFLPYRET